MDYKLAKELKDEGFPQNEECHHEGEFILENGKIIMPWNKETDVEDAYIPLLSELIKACRDIPGSTDFELYDDSINVTGEYVEQWVADIIIYYENFRSKSFSTKHGGCKTPEEAVARLYKLICHRLALINRE